MKDLIKKMDFFSKRFAKYLFRAFPDWKKYLALKPFDESSEAGYLSVNVPAADKDSGSEPDQTDFLRISTDGEVIVGFASYHRHFDLFAEDENFRQAVEFVRSILNEEICAVDIFSSDKWRTSTVIKAGEKPDLAESRHLCPPDSDVFVRSWRGTHDRTYKFADCLENKAV